MYTGSVITRRYIRSFEGKNKLGFALGLVRGPRATRGETLVKPTLNTSCGQPTKPT